LVPTLPGVYAIAGSPPTWHRSLHAGALWLDGAGVVSHRSAAALHGFDRSSALHLDFTVARNLTGRPSRTTPVTLHTTKQLPPSDRVRIDGLAVTAATRTVIDLARFRVPEVVLEASIDSALHLGLSSPRAIALRLGRMRGPGQWGCRTIDRLLVDSGGHTRLERAFLRLIREAGLPRPRPQVVHRRNGQHIARVDFEFEAFRLIVEVSGRRGHSSPSDRARDAQRRNELQALGYVVFEFTWEEVDRDPRRVAVDVERQLRAMGWRR
jgi:very-short-patch-repair endonuclease